jgi:hypothetical protein
VVEDQLLVPQPKGRARVKSTVGGIESEAYNKLLKTEKAKHANKDEVLSTKATRDISDVNLFAKDTTMECLNDLLRHRIGIDLFREEVHYYDSAGSKMKNGYIEHYVYIVANDSFAIKIISINGKQQDETVLPYYIPALWCFVSKKVSAPPLKSNRKLSANADSTTVVAPGISKRKRGDSDTVKEDDSMFKRSKVLDDGIVRADENNLINGISTTGSNTINNVHHSDYDRFSSNTLTFSLNADGITNMDGLETVANSEPNILSGAGPVDTSNEPGTNISLMKTSTTDAPIGRTLLDKVPNDALTGERNVLTAGTVDGRDTAKKISLNNSTVVGSPVGNTTLEPSSLVAATAGTEEPNSLMINMPGKVDTISDDPATNSAKEVSLNNTSTVVAAHTVGNTTLEPSLVAATTGTEEPNTLMMNVAGTVVSSDDPAAKADATDVIGKTKLNSVFPDDATVAKTATVVLPQTEADKQNTVAVGQSATTTLEPKKESKSKKNKNSDATVLKHNKKNNKKPTVG